jgi:hypothetical protein
MDVWIDGCMSEWKCESINTKVLRLKNTSKKNKTFEELTRMRELGIVTDGHTVTCIEVLHIIRTFLSLYRLYCRSYFSGSILYRL